MSWSVVTLLPKSNSRYSALQQHIFFLDHKRGRELIKQFKQALACWTAVLSSYLHGNWIEYSCPSDKEGLNSWAWFKLENNIADVNFQDEGYVILAL